MHVFHNLSLQALHSVKPGHRHRLTVTIRAYDSNFCFDIWHITNADYLLTYLLKRPQNSQNVQDISNWWL